MDEQKFKSELMRVFKLNKLPSLTMEKCDKFTALTKRLLEENEKYNLTAITDPDKIILNHYADCATLAAILPKGAKIADVGCGAGFPTLPVAILRDDVRITAIDSTAKRINYVSETAALLGLSNVTAVAMRAEDGGQNPEYREKFDVVCARAVAELRILMEWCVPFIKKDGIFLSLKGKNAETELENAENAIKKLYCPLTIDEKVTLLEDGEETSERHNFVFKKAKSTDKIYPRRNAQITKNPL
jgi:16S rRNA (guanine527-N7)-methyltransferase